MHSEGDHALVRRLGSTPPISALSRMPVALSPAPFAMRSYAYSFGPPPPLRSNPLPRMPSMSKSAAVPIEREIFRRQVRGPPVDEAGPPVDDDVAPRDALVRCAGCAAIDAVEVVMDACGTALNPNMAREMAFLARSTRNEIEPPFDESNARSRSLNARGTTEMNVTATSFRTTSRDQILSPRGFDGSAAARATKFPIETVAKLKGKEPIKRVVKKGPSGKRNTPAMT